MLENQLSRYGAISKSLPFTTGKVFFVVQTADPQYAEFQANFPPDAYGISRVYSTIQSAVTAVAALTDPAAGHVILVKPGDITDATGDPTSYAETIIIPLACANLTIKGMYDARTQGGLPQIKKGSGSTALLTVRAAGCIIDTLGFNGASSTGGGILLDDNNSTKTAFGTVIRNCHFKNCVGSTATDSRTGGAIMWSSAGNAWQVLIEGNRFYKNVGDIVLMGTSNSVPQDVVIRNNIFSGPTASVDSNLYLAGGSGMNGVIVDSNIFPSVLPSLGSGSVVRYADMTGCVGIFSNNVFGGSYTTTGFGAAKAAAKLPTTVGIAKNYSDAGLIVREA